MNTHVVSHVGPHTAVQYKVSPVCCHPGFYRSWSQIICMYHGLCTLKGLVINYGEGGATKLENRGSETFCATPSRQGKTFRAPPFKEWKLYAPPLQYGLNFKLPRKIYPKTFCAPPSEWLKLFPPPLFVGVKLHVPPPPVL